MNRITTAVAATVLLAIVAGSFYAADQVTLIAKVQASYAPSSDSKGGKIWFKNGEPSQVDFQLKCYPTSIMWNNYEPTFTELISLAPNSVREIQVLPESAKSAPGHIVQSHYCQAMWPLPLGVKKLVWALGWRESGVYKTEI